MKPLTCEMCGSTNLIKDGGVFVCQSCDTKHSVEKEAKTMAKGRQVAATGDIRATGAVNNEKSEKIANLYQLARNAADADDHDKAQQYYEEVLLLDPANWEPVFYTAYYRTLNCEFREIESATKSFCNYISVVLELVRDNAPENEQDDIISEIYEETFHITDVLISWHGDNGDYSHYTSAEEHSNIASSFADMLYSLGNCLIDVFEDKYVEYAVKSWSDGIRWHKNSLVFFVRNHSDEYPSLFCSCIKLHERKVLSYAIKIRMHNPDYNYTSIIPKPKEADGCYIATAVYGSYNCSEVWVLRRFRDNTLKQSILGRLFIRCYYTISPSLVKLFGDKNWFSCLFRKPLNYMVRVLKTKGFADTPYDK